MTEPIEARHRPKQEPRSLTPTIAHLARSHRGNFTKDDPSSAHSQFLSWIFLSEIKPAISMGGEASYILG